MESIRVHFNTTVSSLWTLDYISTLSADLISTESVLSFQGPTCDGRLRFSCQDSFNTRAVMQLPLLPFMSLWLALRYDTSAMLLFLRLATEVIVFVFWFIFFYSTEASVLLSLLFCVSLSLCTVEICIMEGTCGSRFGHNSASPVKVFLALCFCPSSLSRHTIYARNDGFLWEELSSSMSKRFCSIKPKWCKRGRCWKARCQACVLDP